MMQLLLLFDKTEENPNKDVGNDFQPICLSRRSWFEASLIEGSIEVTPYKNPEKQV